MKTKEFLSLLKENSNKSLLFEYKTGQLVGANYHITEVKNLTVDAVDCGANTDFWKETIIQLWESPKEKDKRDYMSAYKALSILNKVDSMKPMEKDVEVKFEYSNPNFHTAQLFVNGFSIENDKVIMKLGLEKTDCKAKSTCGVPVEKVAQEEACCTPSGGCC
ncbi:DUF6428 family protein [Maribacter sp. HTCC2170]|uniref:DUF6428 family protein n=1 Tax=Maribacter sp. (strain HTCC2170 / KCCM 42371) TaxID=313603 RepID=UPI00006BD534|nr:DUF6428 family protein [Maribacter sp. HTCC2170]EAR02468.1 hypothetical protein FB2170_04255 [Maribacter sp. HTCC2170]